MKLNDKQIEAVIEWMNTWEQLKDTSIPIRFKEEFSKPKSQDDIIMDACWYRNECECDCVFKCYHYDDKIG